MSIPILGKLFKTGAEKLVTSIGDAFDKNFTNKEEKAEALLNIEKEVNRHMEAIAMQAQNWYALELKDRDSARLMQIEALKQDDKFSKRFIYYLASFIVVSATFFGIGLMFIEIPEGNKRMVEMYADVYLFGGAMLILNFFFGASIKAHFNNQQPDSQVNKDSVVVNKS